MNLVVAGALTGLVHVAATGAFYGNPWVDGLYARAMQSEAGVKSWPSKPRYLLTQILGTQVEIYIFALCWAWLRPLLGDGPESTAWLALAFCGLRVYPRSWNMWIQSTYPNRLIATETLGGVISTAVIVGMLQWLL